jgi:phenylalanyl-tRNA synthetase beta chain
MKISEHWLRELCSPPGDTAALLHQLTMQGLEVEGVESAGPSLEHVVVGRVAEVTAHPNADRLRVCQVDVGNRSVQIVCGAANVRAGGVYPAALPGAKLPGGLVIRSATLRGAESAGMLCSIAELGLLGDQGPAGHEDGLLELDQGLVAGTPLAVALTLDDHILDLKITPNRADCFSVLGVARDLAAATGVAFAEPEIKPIAATSAHTLAVRIEDPNACPVFVVRTIHGVRADAKSPFWLRERLRRSGIKAIAPIVDVTNLVMLELGQPLHAYDFDRIDSELVVRRARPREPLKLLTGADVLLDDEVLVIADRRGAVGIAGIMGGSGTAVCPGTTNVLLESAFFSTAAIAGRARRLGLQTEAATRFERGVDPSGQQRALERATELILAIAGGAPGVCHAVGSGVPPLSQVFLRRDRLTRVLGDPVPDAIVEAILRRLGMVVRVSANGWHVQAPAFRFDIAVEVDLIEEIARVYGYDRITPHPERQTTQLGKAAATRVDTDSLRSGFVLRGYQEAITYSFVDREQDRLFAGGSEGIPLVNPLSNELAVMRQGLWPGLVEALQHNLARQQRRVRLFEMGVRFHSAGTGIVEESVVSGLASGAAVQEQWGERARTVDFYDVKADLEAVLGGLGHAGEFDWSGDEHPALHPGKSARIRRRDKDVGWLGVLHPSLAKRLSLEEAPVVFELMLSSLATQTRPAFQGLSRFPTVRRDLAVLVVRETPVGQLVAAARKAAGPVLREVIVFDIFEGGHIDAAQKSVALGLILQETSRTLTDDDVEKIVAGVVESLGTKFDARLRV